MKKKTNAGHVEKMKICFFDRANSEYNVSERVCVCIRMSEHINYFHPLLKKKKKLDMKSLDEISNFLCEGI